MREPSNVSAASNVSHPNDHTPKQQSDLNVTRKSSTALFLKDHQNDGLGDGDSIMDQDEFRSHSIAALRAKAHQHAARMQMAAAVSASAAAAASTSDHHEENVFVD